MIDNTLPSESAIKSYDFWCAGYDWFMFDEAGAKPRALELLDLAFEQPVLNMGLGIGEQHFEFQAQIAPNGTAYRFDLFPQMAHISNKRNGAPVSECDIV